MRARLSPLFGSMIVLLPLEPLTICLQRPAVFLLGLKWLIEGDRSRFAEA